MILAAIDTSFTGLDCLIIFVLALVAVLVGKRI